MKNTKHLMGEIRKGYSCQVFLCAYDEDRYPRWCCVASR